MPGTRFQERYEILTEVGAGGFGRVYRARQLSTGQDVAVKILRFHEGDAAADIENQRQRFQREMRLCAALSHPHLVRLIDSGEFASALMAAIVSAAFLGLADDVRVAVPFAAVSGFLLVYAMVRHGFLAMATAAYVWSTLRNLPMTLDTSVWYFDRALLGFAVVIGLALFGLVVSLGGKPLFGTPLFDEGS